MRNGVHWSKLSQPPYARTPESGISRQVAGTATGEGVGRGDTGRVSPPPLCVLSLDREHGGMPAQLLTIEMTRLDAGRVRLRLTGELDYDTAPS